MPSKKNYHHGDLRSALLKAALTLLETKGAKSLSLREVAREAGVSHTAPYRHFTDKAALLAAVAEEGFIEFGQYLKEAVERSQADPIASLQATGVAYIRYALDHPTHFDVMFSTHTVGLAENCRLQSIAQGTFEILVGIITAGQAARVMKAGDPQAIATERWAIVHGLAMLLLNEMLPASANDWPQADGDPRIALARAIIADSLTSVLLDPAPLGDALVTSTS
jgi:AcrR family transcriptional regulator